MVNVQARRRLYSAQRFNMTHKPTESSADFKHDPRRDHAIGGNFLFRGVSKHALSGSLLLWLKLPELCQIFLRAPEFKIIKIESAGIFALAFPRKTRSQRLRLYSTQRFSMTHKPTESSADFKHDPRRDHAIGGNFLSRGVSKHVVS